MTQTLSNSGYPLFVGKVRKWGTSHVLILSPAVRARLGLVDGSLVAMRIHEPFATLRGWPPPHVPDPKSFPPEQQPPTAEEHRKRA